MSGVPAAGAPPSPGVEGPGVGGPPGIGGPPEGAAATGGGEPLSPHPEKKIPVKARKPRAIQRMATPFPAKRRAFRLALIIARAALAVEETSRGCRAGGKMFSAFLVRCRKGWGLPCDPCW